MWAKNQLAVCGTHIFLFKSLPKSFKQQQGARSWDRGGDVAPRWGG